MENYIVSVIIPVYNAKRFIEKSVHSVINQTYKNIEIILVDDGSSDGSDLICDEISHSDSRIRVFHKNNGGLISAWKYGVDHSIGNYFCFVDCDDWVDSEMIEELSAQLSGTDSEIISSDYVIEYEDGRKNYVWQELPSGEYFEKEIKEKVIPQILGNEQRKVCLSRCMKLISRKLILDNMKYSNPAIRMGEDTTIILPSLIDCKHLVIMDHKAWYHYLYVNSSMVHKYDAGMYENFTLLRNIIIKIIGDKIQDMAQRGYMIKRADMEYVFLMLLVIKNESRGNPKGYRSNIREYCNNEETMKICRNTDISVNGMANKILYKVLINPSSINITILRMIMVLYYR